MKLEKTVHATIHLTLLAFPVNPAIFESELKKFHDEDLNLGTGLKADYKIGFIDGKLKYLEIDAYTNCKFQLPRGDKLPIYEDWEDLRKEINDGSPEGMNKALQSADGAWAWYHK